MELAQELKKFLVYEIKGMYLHQKVHRHACLFPLSMIALSIVSSLARPQGLKVGVKDALNQGRIGH